MLANRQAGGGLTGDHEAVRWAMVVVQDVGQEGEHAAVHLARRLPHQVGLLTCTHSTLLPLSYS